MPDLTLRGRTGRALLLTTAVIALSGLPASAAAPSCTTADADDGANVPCNPHLASSPYSVAHANSYAQHSTGTPGPAPEDRIQVRHRPASGIVIATFYGPRYRDGKRVAWIQTLTATNAGVVYKLDLG